MVNKQVLNYYKYDIWLTVANPGGVGLPPSLEMLKV